MNRSFAVGQTVICLYECRGLFDGYHPEDDEVWGPDCSTEKTYGKRCVIAKRYADLDSHIYLVEFPSGTRVALDQGWIKPIPALVQLAQAMEDPNE